MAGEQCIANSQNVTLNATLGRPVPLLDIGHGDLETPVSQHSTLQIKVHGNV